MTKAQHTPGPWEFAWDDVISRAPEFTSAPSKRRVAKVSLGYKDSATYAANGYLIAAAPELAEALEELLIRPTRDAQAKARAALAKARPTP